MNIANVSLHTRHRQQKLAAYRDHRHPMIPVPQSHQRRTQHISTFCILKIEKFITRKRMAVFCELPQIDPETALQISSVFRVGKQSNSNHLLSGFDRFKSKQLPSLPPDPSQKQKLSEAIILRRAFGAANQIRTGDLILTKDVLYHLSHSSKWRPGTGSNRRPLA